MARSTVAVRFTGDVRDLKKSLNDVDGGMAKLGAVAKKAGAAAAVGFAAFGVASIKAGSDLEETLSKSNTVFGESAKQIEDWAEGAAGSFGQSKREALDAASSFGNMFTQLGIGEEQAADMSKQMTELASDFASFHNADITQVIEAQSAAFRGEYDALQRFVPTISAATVEQEALAQTGKATTKELTAQEKALAVQTLMMEGAGDAAGDFDRTSDSLANRQRILAARFEDVQGQVGEALIPVLLKLADAGLAVIGFMKDLPGPVKTALAAFAGAGATAFAVAKIADAVKGVTGTLKSFGPTIGKAANAMGGLSSAAGAIPFLAVGAGIAAWQIESKKAQYDIQELTAAFTDMTDAGQESSEAFVKALAVTDDLDRAVEEMAQTNVKAAERMVDLAEKTGLPKDEIEALREVIERKRSSDVGGAQDQAAYTAEVQEAAGATEGLTGALLSEEDALQGVLDATLAQFDSNLQYRQSVDSVEGALHDLKVTREEEGAQSEAYRDQMLETEGAILRQADAAVKMAEDTAAGFGVTLEAKDKQRIYREELVKVRDTTAPGSPLRKAIDGYIARLDAVPPTVDTKINLSTAEAHRRLGVLERAMLAIRIQAIALDAAKAAGRASGGPVKAGTPYVVGEKGPELMIPNRSGTIVPNGTATKSPVPTAGGVNLYVNIAVPPTMDAGAAGQSITEALAAYVRRNGANDLRRLLGV